MTTPNDHGNDLNDNAEKNGNERKSVEVEKELESRNVDKEFISDVKMILKRLKEEEMLVAKLPDPPSDDPNEGDIKDEEILRKLSKLKKFNKKWLDNKNSAPVEENVGVTVKVLKEVEETGVPKVDTKRVEVMKAKAEIADDKIKEEKEHPFVEEIIVINKFDADVKKEEHKFESFEVKVVEGKPLDHSALDTNDEALDAEENDHVVDESSEVNEEEIFVNESDEDAAEVQEFDNWCNSKQEERMFSKSKTKNDVKSSIKKIVEVKHEIIEEELEEFNDDALEQASKLRLTDEQDDSYKKGFEKTPEILTMGQAVMLVNARVGKVKERQEFSNYLISPNKFKFEKFVRVLSITAACIIVKRILSMVEKCAC